MQFFSTFMNINDPRLLIEYDLKLLWRGAVGSKTEVSSIIQYICMIYCISIWDTV